MSLLSSIIEMYRNILGATLGAVALLGVSAAQAQPVNFSISSGGFQIALATAPGSRMPSSPIW
ncbi:hypothetical protein [Falsiroseomonas sp. E2-1-a4]|uniref:hypothetical protein n=1 Tax=Falsiroseomonas sp. E2-1-a4 TaxID=3239299 RepID=UPI003F341D01